MESANPTVNELNRIKHNTASYGRKRNFIKIRRRNKQVLAMAFTKIPMPKLFRRSNKNQINKSGKTTLAVTTERFLSSNELQILFQYLPITRAPWEAALGDALRPVSYTHLTLPTTPYV